MRIGKPARLVVLATAVLAVSAAAKAQGSGDGYLFAPPTVTFTVVGGFAAPLAGGSLFDFTTRELTLGRSDFGSSAFGLELGITTSRRTELMVGYVSGGTKQRSEFRDWVDNNDLPIEQSTRFDRTPVTVNLRYYLTDRGRRIGSVAWIPNRFVPFVSGGVGLTKFRFEQDGDFIDMQTLNVFRDNLRSQGWARTLHASGGAQWSLSTRMQLTGEVRYMHGGVDASRGDGDFVGYRLDLSGVSTVIGLTLRL
ncbi:MAG: hypothetical protein ACKVS7_06205 [Gemmatimonadaceae bacterium]